MSLFADRYREEGMQQGEVAVLLRQMKRKFGGRLTAEDRRLVESADEGLNEALGWYMKNLEHK